MKPVQSPAAGTDQRPRARSPRAPRRPRLRALRSLPGALWACMAIAFVNALAWALLTPAFQGPDEPAHAGYAQYIAETGKVPRPVSSSYQAARDAQIVFEAVPWSLTKDPSWLKSNDRELDRALEDDLPSESESGAGYIAPNPPLYYAIEAAAYKAAVGGTFLDRLYVMRVVSALLAALTVGFVFLFVRELLPGVPWAWTVGSLAVAFQPTFGFIGGVVNNDNLLWAASAALFWLMARAFRRGLSTKLAIAIGAAVGVGLLSKLSMVGLVPGVVVGLALLVWRSPRALRRPTLARSGLALAVGAPAVIAWVAAGRVLWDRAPETSAGGLEQVPSATVSGQLGYLWQFYLPKLGFMYDWFPDWPTYPLWDVYFEAFVGRFGWFTFGFPEWVSYVALGVVAGLIGLAGWALARHRTALRRRWPELACYTVMLAGLAVLVNILGYRYLLRTETNFEQVRYVFAALLPLYGALVALAVRAPGRLGPAVGVIVVALAAVHSLFAHFVLVAHYYN